MPSPDPLKLICVGTERQIYLITNHGQGKKWLVLGLIWQLIKMFLFKRISVAQIPGLVNLLRPGEDVSELMKLSPEQLLLRWVNFQLEKVHIEKLNYCGIWIM